MQRPKSDSAAHLKTTAFLYQAVSVASQTHNGAHLPAQNRSRLILKRRPKRRAVLSWLNAS